MTSIAYFVWATATPRYAPFRLGAEDDRHFACPSLLAACA